MGSAQAAEVKEFLAKESGPEKQLGCLPWQLADDCTKTDAVARIYFARVVHEEMSGPVFLGAGFGEPRSLCCRSKTKLPSSCFIALKARHSIAQLKTC
jgi:hypothetical protein